MVVSGEGLKSQLGGGRGVLALAAEALGAGGARRADVAGLAVSQEVSVALYLLARSLQAALSFPLLVERTPRAFSRRDAAVALDVGRGRGGRRVRVGRRVVAEAETLSGGGGDVGRTSLQLA